MSRPSNAIKRQLGELRATLDGRTDATAATLLQAANSAGYWISADGRIGEADLAVLLGFTTASMGNKRRDGSGPPAFALGGGGHRITYRLADVARWLESHRS